MLFYRFVPASRTLINRIQQQFTFDFEQEHEQAGTGEQNNVIGPASGPGKQEDDSEDRSTGLILAAVGDIMIHSPQITSAYLKSEDRYDFQENYVYVTPYFKKADFVLGNLETTLAGKEYGGYSGYPLFNSPPELAGVLKKSGFDLLITANNHTLDRGEAGIINTIHNLEEAGLDFVGTARHWEERKKGFLLNRNGLKVAFFAYTYGTNGLPVPAGKDYLVSLINEQRMREDIFRAKYVEDADIIVFCMHWGHEYHRIPSDQQKEMARKLIDLGVHIIIGNHPHVVQQVEVLKTEKNTGLVFYSLGNFISNQRERYCDTGIIVYIKILPDFDEANVFHISLLDIEPAWVHKLREEGRWQYRILPVREVLNTEQAQEAFNLSATDRQRVAEVFQETEEIIYWGSPFEMTFSTSK